MQVLGVDDLIGQIVASLGIPAEMPLQAENKIRADVRWQYENDIREKYLSGPRAEIGAIKSQAEKLLGANIAKS